MIESNPPEFCSVLVISSIEEQSNQGRPFQKEQWLAFKEATSIVKVDIDRYRFEWNARPVEQTVIGANDDVLSGNGTVDFAHGDARTDSTGNE